MCHAVRMTTSDLSYTTGADWTLSDRRRFGAGGYGQVHGVSLEHHVRDCERISLHALLKAAHRDLKPTNRNPHLPRFSDVDKCFTHDEVPGGNCPLLHVKPYPDPKVQ